MLINKMALDKVIEETPILGTTGSGFSTVSMLLVVNPTKSDCLRNGTLRIHIPLGQQRRAPPRMRPAAEDPVEVDSDGEADIRAPVRTAAGQKRREADPEFVDAATRALEEWRLEEARQTGVNPDVVFRVMDLESIAKQDPRSIEDLKGVRVQGLGQHRLKKYQNQILNVLNRVRCVAVRLRWLGSLICAPLHCPGEAINSFGG